MSRLSLAWFGVAAGVVVAAFALDAATADGRLTEAAERGDVVAVRTLVRQKVDVNAPLSDGTTTLHVAAAGGQADIVQILIDAGANVRAVNRYGSTPLFEAAAHPSGRTAALLLKAGASPNEVTTGGETVLMTAARYGNVEAARALIEAGADIDSKESTHDQTALMFAAGTGHASVVQLLVERGAQVSLHDRVMAPTAGGRGGGGGFMPPPAAGPAAGRGPAAPVGGAQNGRAGGAARGGAQGAARGGGFGRGGPPQPTGSMTALLYAARQGDEDSIGALLEGGADIDEVDAQGWTALQLAINNTHYAAASLLIARGANPNRADNTGRSPLYSAVDIHTAKPASGKPIRPELDRMTSVQVAEALLDRGANPDAKLAAGGNTPFLRAASDVDLPMIDVLLAKGADPTLVNDAGNNAIMMMLGMGGAAGLGVIGPLIPVADTLKAVQICLDRGIDVNAANNVGDTALHGAARTGSDVVVKFLVAKGARLDPQNDDGFTPLDVAEGKGQGPGRAGPGGLQKPGHESTAALLRELMSAGGPSGTPSPVK